MKRFRGGAVFKADRLVHDSRLGSNKEEEEEELDSIRVDRSFTRQTLLDVHHRTGKINFRFARFEEIKSSRAASESQGREIKIENKNVLKKGECGRVLARVRAEGEKT